MPYPVAPRPDREIADDILRLTTELNQVMLEAWIAGLLCNTSFEHRTEPTRRNQEATKISIRLSRPV